MRARKRILILFAHPAAQKSRVNSQMVQSVRAMDGITFHDLYEVYPDLNINVKQEQELLLDHDIIVWHHPFYWYSAPAILKEWIDLVLEHGFAYGRNGTRLKSKWLFNAITTGGRKEAYQQGGFNRFTMREFLVPFQRTAELCNMEYLPPFVVHGSHLFTDEEIGKHADDYRKTLSVLRDEMLEIEELTKLEYLNDLVIAQQAG